ncbi:hypothetical protein V6N12_026349 [Hibiscus sabdariffa]|uniref:MSP domain-containing protein n=1 Tax=Hibiscus sabdariffa TaxID=183260 RepID=A0ABR2DRJ4_9ROSI
MNTQLLEIEPKELEFTFILKKQSSCSVRLTNNTDQYVAFKLALLCPNLYVILQVAKVEESKMINLEKLKPTKDVEWKPRKDMLYADDLKLKPKKDVNEEDLKFTKDPEVKPKNNFFNSKELKPVKDVDSMQREGVLDTEEFNLVKEKEFNPLKDGEGKTLKTVEELKFAKDMKEMKSKVANLESKLGEAEATILKLTEERRLSAQERKILEEELALLRKKAKLREVKGGFSLLFVCMVALISTYIGYFLALKNKASMSDLYRQ